VGGLAQTNKEKAKGPPRSSLQLHERGLKDDGVRLHVVVPDNTIEDSNQKP